MSRFARVDLREERGVTLVIVAILIVAIFGMLTLVIDVGGLLVKKRSLVAAADSAALAAAESCAVGRSNPLHPGGPAAGDPEAVADQFAAKNATGLNSGSTNILPAPLTVGCETQPTGRVTVTYTAPQEIFFGPVIGTGNSTNITANATAEWVPGGATNPMPFVISEGAFSSTNCTLPNVPVGTRCYIWEDNGGGGASNFGGSVFGALDLRSWDVGPTGNCNGANRNKGDNAGYAGAGGYDGSTPLTPLNYPAPTYVCLLNGLAEGPFFGPGGLGNPLNFTRLLTFPVISEIEPYNDRFNVIGFVKMKLIDILRPKDGGAGAGSGDCTYSIPPAVTSVDLDSALAAGGGVGQSGTCPNSAANSDVLSITSITGCGNVANSPCSTPGDYTMDSNHVVTFSAAPRTGNVTLTFHWETFGVCGVPPGGNLNNSGHCLVLEWEGFQLGDAPGGKNFGLDMTRLCDATITTSCKSTS